MAYAPPGLFTIITYQADSFVFIILGAALSFGLAAVLTFFFGIPKAENKPAEYKENPSTDAENDSTEIDSVADADSSSAKSLNNSASENENTAADSCRELTVCAPIPGAVIPISEIPDDAFSSGIMGQGVGIQPSEGKVYAPFDGKVETIFDTKHALGLTSDDGVSLIIHVGLDTVELNGQYFTAHVASGDSIQKGQLLLEFDLEKIAEKYKTVTPVLVLNTDDYAQVTGISGMDADNDTAVINIKTK